MAGVTAPELAAELDRIGKAHGATLAASGAQDVFWLNLVATLMGAAHRIDSVEGRCTWNADDYGPEVAAHVHLGESREAFDRHLAEHGWPDFVVRSNLEALVAAAGLTGATVDAPPSLRPWPRPTRGRRASARPCRRAPSSASSMRSTIETREGPAFSFEMAGRVYAEGEVDTNEWVVHGEPELRLFNDAVPTRLITCTSMVNRIPDVIAAPPGLVTLDRSHGRSYRHGGAHRSRSEGRSRSGRRATAPSALTWVIAPQRPSGGFVAMYSRSGVQLRLGSDDPVVIAALPELLRSRPRRLLGLARGPWPSPRRHLVDPARVS